jgi:threonine 3-dehydrogenase
MKAIIKKKAEPGLQLENSAIPSISNDELLIKVHRTSICGTDLHIYKWDEWAQKTVPIPMVIGHEFVGEISEVGSNVKEWKEGDRISGEGHFTCGKCDRCRTGLRHLCPNTRGLGVNCPGCFAEYFKLTAENAFKIPEQISNEIATILDPFGNAVHTTLSFELIGEDILITGAGPIGIMAAAIARKAGAHSIVISDYNPYRLELAKRMGATHTVNLALSSVQEMMKSNGLDSGFTIGFEMSGHPEALSTLLETAQPGAHIALLGILPSICHIDWDLVIFKMLTIKGIYGREIFKTWYQMIHLIESGLDLQPVITHHFPFQEFENGFEAMFSGNCGKVILDWT